jgi:hypothetical protein
MQKKYISATFICSSNCKNKPIVFTSVQLGEHRVLPRRKLVFRKSTTWEELLFHNNFSIFLASGNFQQKHGES